jgi:hypothetical protein
MVIKRTVQQTVDGLVASYETDIKRIAGNDILSKTEQAKLSPFAKKHIEARAAGKALRVSQAVSALKPVLTRAAKAIAGADGMIDAAEVQQLRVAELRTRAASLFEESPSAGKAALLKAIEGVDIPEISDFGRSFGLEEYPKSATVESMVEDITDIPRADMGPVADWGTVTKGQAAVDGFVTVVKDAGQEMFENAEEPAEGEDLKARMNKFATAVNDFFKPGAFKQIVGVRHTIEEDGDVEQNLLFGQKLDGAWVVLNHTDFPF